LCGTARTLNEHQQLSQLPFVEAFANETMRLKPIGPFFPMETNEDVELLGYRIPKATPLIVLTRHIATNSANFGAPEQFNPARWLKPNETDTGPHNTQAFLPFGTGPRFCPGRNLALVEIKMALAMLCRNFDLTLSDPTKAVEEKLAFAMLPINLTVRLSRREQR